MGGRPRDPARVFEDRRLYRIEAACPPHLNRLENERTRTLSTPALVIEEGKSVDRSSISHLWVSRKI
jgi:hypothetical protein